MTDSTAVIACTLDDEAFSDRKILFQQRLLPQALQKFWIKNGLQIIFAKDPILRAELQAFIALERQCCEFLDFELKEDIKKSRLLLSVTGPVETQQFLRQMVSVSGDSGDGHTDAAKRASNTVLKRTGLASIAIGVGCLLVCELPVLLAIVGLGGLGAWLAYFQPGPVIEAGASTLIFAGSIAYVVWRRRTSHTQPSE